MNYTGTSAAGGDDAADKKIRLEEATAEERTMREMMRSYWPSHILSSQDTRIPRSTLRSMCTEHVRPHTGCGMELWYLNGRFGETRRRRYSFFASFSTIAVVDDAAPPEVGSPFTNCCVLSWAITDHVTHKYYRFSELDYRTPVLLSALIAKRQVRGETHLMQAMVEQLSQDKTILPDRLMDKPTTIRLNELELLFGNSYIKELPPANELVNVPQNQVLPMYELHLEGCTFENGDDNQAEEVRAVLELVIQPVLNPMLEGDHGVVSTGNWEDDYFGFITPHMRVKSGFVRLTRASDERELSRELDVRYGSAWMERRFGGAVPHTVTEGTHLHALRKTRELAKVDTEEMCDRCMLRLFNEGQDCISVTHFMDTPSGFTRSVVALVQEYKKKEAYQYSGAGDGVELRASADPEKVYRSNTTGTLYPTEWTLRCPLYDGRVAQLTITAEVKEQEFVNAYTQPSFWEGAVTVSGTITEADATTTTPVNGEGFVSSRGRGMQVEVEKLFNLLHIAGVAPMEQPEIGQLDSWETIADGPALSAVSTVSVLFSMQERSLTDAQKIVLSALLAAYGFIYHHPEDHRQVTAALEWCYGRWAGFYAVPTIDFSTLLLRSFMLRELGALVTAKCPAAVRGKAVALDIATPRPQRRRSSTSSAAAYEFPTPTVLCEPATALELSQLKALLDGVWTLKSTKGSMNDVLIEQSVGVLWRNLFSKVSPSYKFSVDRASRIVTLTATTFLQRAEHRYNVDGSEWTWKCPGRGPVTSRACVLLSGRQLYVETRVQSGVQRSWFTVDVSGKAVQERIAYYAAMDSIIPVAVCERVFVLEQSERPQ